MGAPVNMQIREIDTVIIHKDFDNETYANDIALVKLDVSISLTKRKILISLDWSILLLKLQRPVKYSDYTVPICLPSNKHEDFLGVEATFASFMVESDTLSVFEDDLRKSDRLMLTLNDEGCSNKFDKESVSFNSTIQICSLHDTSKATLDSQPVNITLLDDFVKSAN